jgi:hypothetical protein
VCEKCDQLKSGKKSAKEKQAGGGRGACPPGKSANPVQPLLQKYSA